jgi:cytochrome c peroxidase
MKKTFLYSLAVLAIGATIFSCAKENNTAVKYESQNLTIPEVTPNYAVKDAPMSLSTFNAPPNTTNTPTISINNEVALLGRVLFYDKKLSINNTVSCGSCHNQRNAFADNGSSSVGFNGEKTSRNSMAICNTAFTQGFFWDKRAMNIEDLVLQPVRNHVEMGMESTTSLIKKLGKTDYYAGLFKRAYGSEEITREKVVEAMTTFLNSMVSANTKFDQGKRQSFTNFSPIESQGMKIFQKECVSCHSGSSFNSNTWDDRHSESANIGLDMKYNDEGMGAFVDKSAFDFDQVDILTGFPVNSGLLFNGIFKVPSLRNVELTGPYMHDGRFKTLEAVIEHYNSGIQNHPALDWRLQELEKGAATTTTPKKFNWTDAEKASLVAFLKTLTDNKMVSDTKYANPFVK